MKLNGRKTFHWWLCATGASQMILLEAWWRRGNTFASHRYGLSSSPGWCCGWCLGSAVDHMWVSFTLHSQCLVVFPSGFSSTLRRALNCSVWNRLIRPIGLARMARMALPFTHSCFPTSTAKSPGLSQKDDPSPKMHVLIIVFNNFSFRF